MIENLEYKSEWKLRLADGLECKCEWVHPLIDNPAFGADDAMYIVAKNIMSGTMFDDSLVTDSENNFKAHATTIPLGSEMPKQLA
ncbi:hypothetical protein PInf_015487 [Phytophthora infestans]|nr:hypothetical protein PInf_015487 [Phytophthora infestans]